MLEEITKRRKSSREVVELERREYELWLEYRQLDHTATSLANRGSKEQIRRARKQAVRAHSKHQKCVGKILRLEQEQLIADSRRYVPE